MNIQNNTYAQLLADVIEFRDECRVAQRDLIQAADPTGDARLAYGICADRLTMIIEAAKAKEAGE